MQLPVFNFFDPASLVTWFECRHLVLNIGSNYANRVKVYTTIYLLAMIILDVTFFLAFSNLLPWNTFSSEAWISLAVLAVTMTISILKVMYPFSYLNEETTLQIERVTKIKELMFRLAHDESVLTKNPNTIFNRAQMSAMKYYRACLDKNLSGDAFKEAMKEQIERTISALDTVQANLEYEFGYSPQTFLGFVLMPDTITSWLSFIATFGFGIIQSQGQR